MIWNYLRLWRKTKDIKKAYQKHWMIQFNKIVKTITPFPEMNTFTSFYVITNILSQICDSESILQVDHNFPAWVSVLFLFKWIF